MATKKSKRGFYAAFWFFIFTNSPRCVIHAVNFLKVNNDLVINATESEIVIALLEDRQLVEIHKEKRNKHFSVGDIYLGKVKKIMPGLNAAFVDVGYEKDAFLHYQDLGP